MIVCSVYARVGSEKEVKAQLQNAAEKGAFTYQGVSSRHGYFKILCDSMDTVEALRKMEDVAIVGWRSAEAN